MAVKKAKFLNDKQKTMLKGFLRNICTAHPSKDKND